MDYLLCNIANNDEINITKQEKNIKLALKQNLITQNLKLTQKGYDYIEKYKIKKVILNAAGVGTRLNPITKITPKPLIKVKNKPIIEKLIEEIIANTFVEEISIVVWYLKEQFYYLVKKYEKNVKINLVLNNEAEYKNNISTFEKVKNIASNSYVMDGDIIINGKILKKYLIDSTFFAKYVKNESKEWMIICENEVVKKISVGGKNNHYLSGISFLNKNSAELLKKFVDAVYIKKHHENLYWEQLIVDNIDKLTFVVENVLDENLIELDNLEELIAYDSFWKHVSYDDKTLVKKIAHDVFFVTTEDIKNINKITGGITNKTYSFEINSQKYIIRLTQNGTNQLINRENEQKIYNELKKISIGEKIIKFYPQSGIKISHFYDSITFDSNLIKEEIQNISKIMYKFHNTKFNITLTFDPILELNKYQRILEREGLSLYPTYYKIKNEMLKKYEKLKPTFEYKFCHNDFVSGNLLKLKKNGKIIFIDWEYAGVNDCAFDIASLFSENRVDLKKQNDFWDNYPISENSNIKKRVEFWIQFQNLLWSVWHLYSISKDYVEDKEYGLNRFKQVKKYLDL